MTRQQDDEGEIPAWTGFNQTITDDTPHTSTFGYLPIIPAPAHDMDTMMTVMLHCQGIARKLGAQSTVLTLDQALYCKAKQLVWLHPDRFNDATVRLGGFHIALNFLGVIGSHFDQCGLADIWVESAIYSQYIAEQILHGKSWNRGAIAHKLTMEALWRTLMESFKAWQERNNKQSIVDLNQFADGIASHFNDSSQPLLQEKVGEFTSVTEDYLADLTQYIEENEKNPTFVFLDPAHAND